MSQSVKGAKIDKLEALRGFAAIYVLFSHISSNVLHLQKSWIGQPFRFAQEGVLLFFLLSGFVIYYSWHETALKSFPVFLYKRFRRIYPIFLVALGLTYVIACLNAGNLVQLPAASLLGNLLMVQGFDHDIGWMADPFMGNGPLWSLSYEWWFYIMFYLIYTLLPGRNHQPLVLGLALFGIVGGVFVPNILFHILASFPIWWCGVEFAREYLDTGTFCLARQKGSVLILIVCAIAYAGVAFLWHHRGLPLNPIDYPLVKLRHYVVALALIAFFFAWKKTGYFLYEYTLKLFVVFAGISYGIYVLHYPIICQLHLLPSSWIYAEVVLKIALVISLAWLVESIWQKRVNRQLDAWFWKPSNK